MSNNIFLQKGKFFVLYFHLHFDYVLYDQSLTIIAVKSDTSTTEDVPNNTETKKDEKKRTNHRKEKNRSSNNVVHSRHVDLDTRAVVSFSNLVSTSAYHF